MAVKSTAAKVAPKARNKHKSTKSKSRAVGLNLTSAQWKVYQKAYSAAYQNVRLNNAARSLRSRRLLAANKAIQQYSSARNRAQTASIAAAAVAQSAKQAANANQNAALRARVNENLRQHISVLSKAQYKQASEQAYMQQAIQRTQTEASARSYEAKAYKAATRISKINYRPAASAVAASVKTAAQQRSANQQAGQRTSASLGTSTTAARGRTGIHASSPRQSAKSNRATSTGQRSQAAAAKSSARAHASAAKSLKAPVVTYKARTAPVPQIRMYQFSNVNPLSADYGIPVLNEFTGWYTNEDEPVCILAALANHLLLTTRIQLHQEELRRLNAAIRHQRQARLLPHGQDILTAVMAAKSWPFSERVKLRNAWPAKALDPVTPGMVIGYEADTGSHAALLMPGHRVISWGEELPFTVSIDEAWVLEWEVHGGRAD